MSTIAEMLVKIGADTKKFDESMKNVNENMQGVGQRMKGIGAVMAQGLAVGASAAAAGLSGVVLAGDNLQKSLNSLQAQTGATTEEMAQMEDSLKSIYAANYGESFQDIASSMAYVKQTTGLAGNELEALTKNALMLRDTFGYEVNESVEAADQMMKQFGITSKEAMTLLAQGTQEGLNKSDDLMDTVNEYSVYFKQAGLDAEEMFNVFKNASDAGVRNLDFVGDAFKEMVIRTKDMSDTTREAFQQLGLDAAHMESAFAKGGETGKKAFQEMMLALDSVGDPLQKNAIGVALFGTKFEDLEAGAISAMSNIDGEMKATGNTLQEINKIKYETLGAAFQGLGRQMVTGFVLPLSEQLLPILNKFANWIQTNMPKIQEKASQVFNSIQDVIRKVVSVFTSMKNSFDSDGENIKATFNEMYEKVKAVMNNLKEIILSITSIIVGLWKVFGDDVVRIFKGAWDIVVSVLKSVTQILSGVLDVFIGLFSGDFSRMGEGIKKIWTGLWDGVTGILKGAKGVLVNVVKGLADGIATVFKNLASGAVNWGSDIVRGMIRGIGNMAGSLFNKARELANGVANKIKSALQIHSPSKVTTKLGEYTGEGMALGLEKSLNQVQKQANNLANVSVPNISAGSNQVTTNNSPISVTLNYSGAGNVNDAYSMIDILETELGNRLGAKMRVNGVKG